MVSSAFFVKSDYGTEKLFLKKLKKFGKKC